MATVAELTLTCYSSSVSVYLPSAHVALYVYIVGSTGVVASVDTVPAGSLLLGSDGDCTVLFRYVNGR